MPEPRIPGDIADVRARREAVPVDPDRVGIRALTEADLPQVRGWLATPHVARWWREDLDADEIDAAYRARLAGAGPVQGFVILLDEQPAGYLQASRLADAAPAWAPEDLPGDAAVVGWYLGDVYLLGWGVGTTALRQFTDEVLFAQWQAPMAVLAPPVSNLAAQRAAAKAGYREHASARDRHGVEVVVMVQEPPAA